MPASPFHGSANRNKESGGNKCRRHAASDRSDRRHAASADVRNNIRGCSVQHEHKMLCIIRPPPYLSQLGSAAHILRMRRHNISNALVFSRERQRKLYYKVSIATGCTRQRIHWNVSSLPLSYLGSERNTLCRRIRCRGHRCVIGHTTLPTLLDRT